MILLSKLTDISLSILIRLIFLVQIGFSIYFLVAFYNQYVYFVLLFGVLTIVCDGLYIAIARNGKEFKW